jgi:hypothetical protein
MDHEQAKDRMYLNDDYIICFDCCKPLKLINMLHLRVHGYESVNEYKNRHDIPFRTALCSVNTSRIKAEYIDKDYFAQIRNKGEFKAGKSESKYKKSQISKKIKEAIREGDLVMPGGRNKDGSFRELKWKKEK